MAKKKVTKKKSTKKAAKKNVRKTTKRTAKKSAKKTTKKAAKKAAKKKTVKKKAVKKTTKKKAPKKTAKKSVKKKAVKKKAAKKAVKKKALKKAVKKTAQKKAVKKSPATKNTKKRSKNSTLRREITPRKKPQMRGVAMSQHQASGYYAGVQVCEEPGFFPTKTPHSAKNLKALKKMLETRREDLLDTIRELDRRTFHTDEDGGQAKSSGYSIHIAEDAAENFETETSLLLRQEEEMALVQVGGALERMEEGLYGVCVACAAKIGLARLRAVPEAHLCIECKQSYDKKQSRR